MSMYARIKTLFDVPSGQRGGDYSKEISACCKFGVLLLYRDYLDCDSSGHKHWMPEVQ